MGGKGGGGGTIRYFFEVRRDGGINLKARFNKEIPSTYLKQLAQRMKSCGLNVNRCLSKDTSIFSKQVEHEWKAKFCIIYYQGLVKIIEV